MANRIRPTLDALETREVCAAMLSSVFAGLGIVTHAGPIHAGPKYAMPHWDAVFELKNTTKQTLDLRVRWEASGAVQTYILAAGQTEEIWVREVGRIHPHEVADVRILNDPAPAAGQVFRVTAGLALAGADGPQAPGPAYVIEPNANGGVTLKGI
jgi:hypothetical protein